MNDPLLKPKKYQRLFLYIGILFSGASIVMVLLSFNISHNYQRLYPIVLPIMIMAYAIVQLKQEKQP